jgi:hypothetical protein
MYLSVIVNVINKQVQEEDLKWEYIVSLLWEAVDEVQYFYNLSICIMSVIPATDLYPSQEMDVLVFSAFKPWTCQA